MSRLKRCPSLPFCYATSNRTMGNASFTYLPTFTSVWRQPVEVVDQIKTDGIHQLNRSAHRSVREHLFLDAFQLCLRVWLAL